MSKFEEWFDKGGLWAADPYVSDSVDIEKESARIAWNACKEEILELLNTYQATDEYIDATVIKEIENL